MLKELTTRKLFLLDGIGALVSAFFLGVVLVSFQEYIGMPVDILYLLAGLAISFAIYSISCYLFSPKNWESFLQFIALINGLYAILTSGLMIHYFQQLTLYGLSYFTLEIIVLLTIIRIEIKATSKQP